MLLIEMNNLPNFIAYISKGISFMPSVYEVPDQLYICLFNQTHRECLNFQYIILSCMLISIF